MKTATPRRRASRKPGRHTDYGDNDQYRPRGSKLIETRTRMDKKRKR